MDRTSDIEILRETVEQKLKRKLLSSGDFDLLAAAIAKESSDRISQSTLKRVWGYVSNRHRLRNETLSILSRFTGYNDWTDFCKAHSGSVDSDMLVDGKISTSDLTIGDRIEIGWNINRICLLEYMGNDRFRVIKAENAKLSAGDTFKTTVLCLGQPLIVSFLKHESDEREYCYIAGRKNGLTKLNKK